MVNKKDLNSSKMDFLGGFSLLLSFVLLQTTFLWYGFGNGLGFSNLQKEGEEFFSKQKFPSGSTERSIASLVFFCFLTHSVFCYLVLVWKEELLGSIGNQWELPPKQGVQEIGVNPTGQSFKEKFGFINATKNTEETDTTDEHQQVENDFDGYQEEGSKMAASVF